MDQNLATIDATCCAKCNSERGTYTMPGTCSNCGADYNVTITKGVDRPYGYFGALCPQCGCRKVNCHARTLP